MESKKDVSELFPAQYVPHDSIHQLFESVNALAVQGYDENRRVIFWNKGSELFYGYTKEEALGKKLEELIIPQQMKSRVIEDITNWLNFGNEVPASELTLRHKNGTDVNVYSSHALLENQQHEKQMYCIDINLKEYQQVKAKAKFKEYLLEATFEVIPDLFFLMDEDGTIIDYHTSNSDDLYIAPEHFIGQSMVALLPPEVADKFKANIAKVISEDCVATFEYELKMASGLSFYEARISHLQQHNKVVTIIRDVTEQHKSAEVILQHAYYDTLTSLPNRFLALDRLSQLITEAERNNEKIAILFLDLDDFKKINDTLGHEVGDKLLVESANRLNKVVRKGDTVGRLGGDEFIILLRGLSHDHNALSIAEHILKIFREPFVLDGRELMVTLSIGIAICPVNGDCSSELLRNADTAMYQAKSLGRNTYSFFTQEMNSNMLRRLEVEEQMRGALERGEFEVYYQPQINVQDNHIIGAEALLRWHNPRLGSISPEEFIPIAEHTGLIVPIGQFVLKQALMFLNEWQCAYQNKYRMAVNLSPRQFRDTELLNFIQESINDANVTVDNVELEITEGVLMIGQTYIDNALIDLNQLGIKLSMDDFGTGYSSLSYLRQYNFDVLKIDRSFINGITLNKADCDLVKATIAMAHSLGLVVVAEGVETQGQHLLLKELACDYAQGYYFSKPVEAKQLMAFTRAFSA